MKTFFALALLLFSCFTIRTAHAYDPYYLECYVAAGPHAYEPNSCYAFVQSGPQTTTVYFLPSNAFLALQGDSVSPPYQWSVSACNSNPWFMPCVISLANHHEKTVTYSVPNFGLTRSATAGYDMGYIP